MILLDKLFGKRRPHGGRGWLSWAVWASVASSGAETIRASTPVARCGHRLGRSPDAAEMDFLPPVSQQNPSN